MILTCPVAHACDVIQEKKKYRKRWEVGDKKNDLAYNS
jgi:hypothetical protein